jgi:pilus assembly protein Flp/PilA
LIFNREFIRGGVGHNPRPLNVPGVSANLSPKKDVPMLRYYINATETMKRLRANQDGVVSFEYIIVAVCIIGAVSAVFGIGAGGAIGQSLTAGINAMTAAFTAAV